MTAQPSAGDSMGLALLFGAAALVFLPAIIVLSRRRTALIAAAFILPLVALAGLVVSSISGLAVLLLLPGIGMSWLAGLLCALAAFMDAAAERRTIELQYRLLTNDVRYLRQPDQMKYADKFDRRPPPHLT